MNQQEIIKKHIKYGKIAHAYLLVGPQESADEKEIFVADVADLLHVPPANHIAVGKNENAVTIDMIRDLTTTTASSAGTAPRIVVIHNTDAFTMQAANAFLKTLEEPLSHTIFFLLASSRAGILPTILSRVWTVRFSNPTFNPTTAGLNVGRYHLNFFQKPLAERYALNEKLAKSDDHGKQFVADLIAEIRNQTHTEIKKPASVAGRAAEYLPHAVEAYELLHFPGAPYRLILDTLASYEVIKF